MFWRKSQLMKYLKWWTKICEIRLLLQSFSIIFLFKQKFFLWSARPSDSKSIHFLRVWVSFSGIKKSLSVYTKTSISLDLINWLKWNSKFQNMRTTSNFLLQNMASNDIYDVIWANSSDLRSNEKPSVNICWFYQSFRTS